MAVEQADFDRWVSEHGPALYRTAFRLVGNRHEAEDLLQDTFRSAWMSRRLFDANRGERAWLASILRRRVVDHWRRTGGHGMRQVDGELEISTTAADPLANDYSDEMQHALDGLAVDLKETLLLVIVSELTHQEAADVLGIPLGTVLSRVSRARARLRELLLARTGLGRH